MSRRRRDCRPSKKSVFIPLPPCLNARKRPPAVDSAAEQRSDHTLMLAVRDGELDALGETL